MNDNAKIEVAREIINVMIARACTTENKIGFPTLQEILKDEQEMENFNFEVIDKILNVYSKIIKGRA